MVVKKVECNTCHKMKLAKFISNNGKCVDCWKKENPAK